MRASNRQEEHGPSLCFSPYTPTYTNSIYCNRNPAQRQQETASFDTRQSTRSKTGRAVCRRNATAKDIGFFLFPSPLAPLPLPAHAVGLCVGCGPLLPRSAEARESLKDEERSLKLQLVHRLKKATSFECLKREESSRDVYLWRKE